MTAFGTMKSDCFETQRTKAEAHQGALKSCRILNRPLDPDVDVFGVPRPIVEGHGVSSNDEIPHFLSVE
jgi:hypothetical protein